MFIIAMTLALLGAMGTYALNVASAEVKSSGYSRQNTQTHYVSEWAVLGGAEVLTRNPQLLANPTGGTYVRTGCPDLPPTGSPWPGGGSPPLKSTCLMLWSTDLGNPLLVPNFTPLSGCTGNASPIEPYTANTNLSTRGDVGLNEPANFLIEYTDSVSVPVKGSSSQVACGTLVTVTGWGVTPQIAPTTASPDPGALTEGLETTRARMIIGPSVTAGQAGGGC
jgi:hypothetical protein